MVLGRKGGGETPTVAARAPSDPARLKVLLSGPATTAKIPEVVELSDPKGAVHAGDALVESDAGPGAALAGSHAASRKSRTRQARDINPGNVDCA
jgi:hypothetical protein